MTPAILVLNAGSSSVKFAAFELRGPEIRRLFSGSFERIGSLPHLSVKDAQHATLEDRQFSPTEIRSQEEAVEALIAWLKERHPEIQPVAIGHRVVHGGPNYSAPVVVNPSVLAALRGFEALAPLHQPHNLAPIRRILELQPDLPQVACFDTAFHRTIPEVGQMYALPHEMYEAGIRRYGFHGLSYEYIVHALAELDPRAASGRLVVAHLGSGCSMAAIRNGKSVACTLGFTALDGLPMGTRCGQIDPGVLLYLMRARSMGVSELEELLYKHSGLKGMSGVSSDMRDLLSSKQSGATIAVDYFVYRVGRELGSLVAALGGLDALVFTGGIGEHAAEIRDRVCKDAAWLNVSLDQDANRRGETRISPTGHLPSTWAIPTDEELMIARHTVSLLPCSYIAVVR
jgi:acetate kinase